MRIHYSIKDYLSIFKHTSIGVDFPTYIGLLKKHRFAIEFPFLLKTFFIGATALVNTPVHWFEKLYYKKKIDSSTVKQPVFILGHPRSGTTYLHYVMSKSPQFAFCSTHDALVPNIMLSTHKITNSILKFFMPATRPQDNMKAGADMPKEEEFAIANITTVSFAHGFYFPNHMMEVFNESVLFQSDESKKLWQNMLEGFNKKLSYKYKNRTLLLKSPANTGRVKEILEVYPDAKFIHIHRDPYTVYQSNVRLYEKILPILGLHKADPKKVEGFIFDSYTGMHKKYLAEKSLIPEGQLYEMSYDAFVRNPLEKLKAAYNTLGLGNFNTAEPHFMEEIGSFSDYTTNKHTPLDEDAIQRINEEWRFFFEEYGYSLK